jgi:hypothetical protein
VENILIMNLEKAKTQSKLCGDKLIVRACCVCDLPLDKASEVITKELREEIDYLISHAYCPEHFKEEMAKHARAKILINL